MKIIKLFIFNLLISTYCFSQYTISYSKNNLEKIRQVEGGIPSTIRTDNDSLWSLVNRMEYYNVPGLTIAVIDNYKLVWTKGYGLANKDENQIVTAKTLFQAGSISKNINAIGILKLVQNEKLNLNEDINVYLKTWKFPYDKKLGSQTINTSHLLSHHAGLSVSGFSGYTKGQVIPTINQILDGDKPANTDAVRSQNKSGISFQYSGGGITILQLMITDITGLQYNDYMQKEVLSTLEMTNSLFGHTFSSEMNYELASGYNFNGQIVPGKFNIYPEEAAAGLWTTSEDLAKYVIETQLSLLDKSNKILSQDLTNLMHSPFLENSISGLGVFLVSKGKNRYFEHKGGNNGFKAQYFGSLDGGKGVVVMINSDNYGIIMEIVNAVSIAYDWEGFYTPQFTKTISLQDDQLLPYAGEYKLSSEAEISISIRRKKLKALWTGHHEVDTFPITENKFIAMLFGSELILEFNKNKKGEVESMTVHQGNDSNTAKKIK